MIAQPSHFGLAVVRLGAHLVDQVFNRIVPPRAEVQRGVATKVSAPGLRSPVVADRPGPVSAAAAVGPGHPTSTAAPRAVVGPDPATPRPGSGHPTSVSTGPHAAEPDLTSASTEKPHTGCGAGRPADMDLAVAAQCLRHMASGSDDEPPHSPAYLQSIAERLDAAAQK